MSLFKEMFLACREAEKEWRHNEFVLQMQLDCAEAERKEIIKLLSNKDISNDDICRRLRIYYDIHLE